MLSNLDLHFAEYYSLRIEKKLQNLQAYKIKMRQIHKTLS